MGLSKKRPQTNLEILRSELSNLTVGEGVDVTLDTQAQNSTNTMLPQCSKGCGVPVDSTGRSTSSLPKKEPKKRGRPKNFLVDGSRLLTCG